MSAPITLTEALLRAAPLPRPSQEGDKDDRGRVLVVGGGAETPGAAILAGLAALRGGAGKLQIGTVQALAPLIGVQTPEALVFGLPQTPAGEISPAAGDKLRSHAKHADVVVYGPGMLDQAAAQTLLSHLLEAGDLPAMVLDAAALDGLASMTGPLSRLGGRAVVTPHSGEMARLLNETKESVEADPPAVARRVAALLQVVVALKGATTYIAAPDGSVWVHRDGHKGLATSGSGDTLAGLIGGLMARGADPALAALWGVYVHGRAGARLAQSVGSLGYLAREIPGQFPAILEDLDA